MLKEFPPTEMPLIIGVPMRPLSGPIRTFTLNNKEDAKKMLSPRRQQQQGSNGDGRHSFDQHGNPAERTLALLDRFIEGDIVRREGL